MFDFNLNITKTLKYSTIKTKEQSFSKNITKCFLVQILTNIILYVPAFAKTQCCQYSAEFQQTQEKTGQEETGRTRGGETWNRECSEKPGKLHKVHVYSV